MTDTRTRTVLGSLAAAAVLTLSACGGGDGGGGSADEPTQESTQESSESSSESPSESSAAPGLDDLPDVVAEVNGEELTKDEFAPFYEARLQQAAAAAEASGQAPDEDAIRTETVENLVDTELLTQEADARGIEVTDDDVETELGSLAEEYQLESTEAFLAALEEQGTTEDEVREQVRTQVVVEALVEDEDGAFAPTEKQLREVYAQGRDAAKAQGQPVPPYAEVREQLEQQAVTERTGRVAQALVEQLRADADIEIFVE